MTGQIIYRREVPHSCDAAHNQTVPSRDGDIWQCDECSQTWIYRDYVDGYAWKKESDRKRRKRES